VVNWMVNKLVEERSKSGQPNGQLVVDWRSKGG
jgi:hypothetical protein